MLAELFSREDTVCEDHLYNEYLSVHCGQIFSVQKKCFKFVHPSSNNIANNSVAITPQYGIREW